MAKKKKNDIDFSALQENIQRQFRGLDPNDPSRWPLLPRFLLCVAIALGVAALLWYVLIKDYEDTLEQERNTEVTLRQDFSQKLSKAVSLDGLKKQREQVQQYVTQLEKQLPSKAEMAALLSDINQAGLGRSLQFETFRPGAMVVKEYYAELPIALKVTGRFHDIGSFASDVAYLSRIVTLNNLSIVPGGKEGSEVLSMEATARTFRYLDAEEVQAQRAAAGKGKK
ncbi:MULTISPECIES: type 4a pilus biogenesis protein PilO [Delftia]|uniref:type 4a pilus biogenesis protein PilO n=1 Tax=Delftia TaxID=80865 RepID=UPI0009285464|nr:MULTISPECIES: type 4a pilus biogenesis protein PilO [Delftia]OJX10801.1 MAG: pilus assembly protein PilO [Delftia sp. 67-8]QFS63871.1 type 4a pilus biogenesis protein PilO [Delftia tsuruhatensis]WON91214.1 type 4a pilus biogenesis protein PilO [Delftia sp. UGAL515B_04]